MVSATEQLLSRVHEDDPFDYDPADARLLQLEAANERFEAARGAMPLLDRRAEDGSVKQIAALEDIIPLFFSDSTYKSYPESFITDRKWRALASWVDTLSTRPGAADVDFSGVETIDDWLLRLRNAGHYLYVSSGTSGRCSMFQVNEADREMDFQTFKLSWRWGTGVLPNRDRPVFALFPREGAHRMMDSFGRQAREFGREGSVFYLGDEPLRVSDVNALGRLRREMANGTAAPSDVQRFEEESARRQSAMQGALAAMADAVVEHADEPALFIGTWAPLYLLLQAAKERGLSGGVHPESVILSGGGLKGIVLPADFREDIRHTLGLDDSRYLFIYGLSELTTFMPRCRAARYHVPPWLIPMVVDEAGEHLLTPDGGRLDGRLALFDLSLEGRWGALVTGDKAVLNLTRCPCGRTSPSIDDTITRYADLPGGDDKVTCAGTIDAYVRGLVGTGE